MSEEEKMMFNKFLNLFWQWVKKWGIPTQAEVDKWDQRYEDRLKWTQKFLNEHKPDELQIKLFDEWFKAFETYSHDKSCGIPTLMQEAKEVAKEV